MSASNSTFQAPIPGSSLTAEPGSMPHMKPPKYTDPKQALEYFWKQLTRTDIQLQIWQLADKKVTIWAITRALLFKSALSGIILMHMMPILAPTISKMIAVIIVGGGRDTKMFPKFKNKVREDMIRTKMKSIMDDIKTQYGRDYKEPTDPFQQAIERNRPPQPVGTPDAQTSDADVSAQPNQDQQPPAQQPPAQGQPQGQSAPSGLMGMAQQGQGQ